MFRKEMQAKLSRIFGLRKTTFDAYSDSFEQDTLFIQVLEANSRATTKNQTARVTGTLIVFSQMDKMPYGYFAKKIEQASGDDTKDFFFYDIDVSPANSPARVQNISERRVSFVYLYKAQYDPEHGTITSVEGI